MIDTSIIVPNYNHAPFLRKRLESIFNQTYKNFEVILLDDASTDNSVEILSIYKDHPQVSHFIVNKSNSGSTFKQWEKGISLSKGQFIWIAESDDWADPQFLEKMLPLFTDPTQPKLVYCGSNCVDDEERPVTFEKFSGERWQTSFFKEGRTEILEELIYHNSICNASAIVFKKSALKRIPFSQYKFCGDWRAAIDVICDHHFGYCAEKLNYYRLNSAGVTFSVKDLPNEFQRHREYIQVMKYALSRITKNQLLTRKRHRWVIFDWLGKHQFYNNKIQYYFPPFPVELLVYFYFYLPLILLKKLMQGKIS